MFLKRKSRRVLVMVLAAATYGYAAEREARTKHQAAVEFTKRKTDLLWRAPNDIASRNMFYGPGGREHQPGHIFRFVKEDLTGSNPKFVVQDETGQKWKVKLGEEAKPETVASRLVWGVGYFADEDYFLPDLQVMGLVGHLSRGWDLVAADGLVHNARLKREIKNREKTGVWHWRRNPFSGTRELNGLRVMMALTNNWDLKDDNNAAYEVGSGRVFLVSDLGASFGSGGPSLSKRRSKGNPGLFVHSKFITKVAPDHVDFGDPAPPPVIYLFTPWRYVQRMRLVSIGKHIPRADAKWTGHLLAQLSQEQIRDAFRAAGYSPAEVDEFTEVVKNRIAQLEAL